MSHNFEMVEMVVHELDREHVPAWTSAVPGSSGQNVQPSSPEVLESSGFDN